jgi:type I restriction enzyme S subunit
MNYPIVQVGDLALEESGSFKIGPFGSSLKKNELVSSGIPVIAIENVLPNNFVTSYRKFITYKKYQELAQYTVLPGDIVVTTMGTIGRAAVVPEGIGMAIIDSHLFRMRIDKTKVHSPYLCYAINGAPSITNHLEKMSRGAIMDGLNTTILKEGPIALPPLPEQRRIANLLSRADRLCRLRRVGDTLYASLLQSVFLEMFGDPFKHYQEKWKSVPFKEITNRITYGFTSPMSHISHGIPIITAKNVFDGQIDFNNVHFADQKEYDALTLKNKPNKGDILITKDGTIGRCAIVDVDFPICINQSVALIQLNSKIIPKYVFGYLYSRSVREFLEGMKKGVALQHLQISEFAQIPIPIPPLPEQERFAKVVRRVESLRRRQAESARQADGLFQSLLNHSFVEVSQ